MDKTDYLQLSLHSIKEQLRILGAKSSAHLSDENIMEDLSFVFRCLLQINRRFPPLEDEKEAENDRENFDCFSDHDWGD